MKCALYLTGFDRRQAAVKRYLRPEFIGESEYCLDRHDAMLFFSVCT